MRYLVDFQGSILDRSLMRIPPTAQHSSPTRSVYTNFSPFACGAQPTDRPSYRYNHCPSQTMHRMPPAARPLPLLVLPVPRAQIPPAVTHDQPAGHDPAVLRAQRLLTRDALLQEDVWWHKRICRALAFVIERSDEQEEAAQCGKSCAREYETTRRGSRGRARQIRIQKQK